MILFIFIPRLNAFLPENRILLKRKARAQLVILPMSLDVCLCDVFT